MSELLRECRLALDDWINTYAPDMCDPMHVAQAYERIANGGGTLAYIATLRQRINAALAAPEATTEPVAWKVIAKGGKFTRGLYEKPSAQDFEIWKADGDIAVPLYARPSAEAVREACAAVCEDLNFPIPIELLTTMTRKELIAYTCLECAKAIRALDIGKVGK